MSTARWTPRAFRIGPFKSAHLHLSDLADFEGVVQRRPDIAAILARVGDPDSAAEVDLTSFGVPRNGGVHYYGRLGLVTRPELEPEQVFWICIPPTKRFGRGFFLLDSGKRLSAETYARWIERAEPRTNDLIFDHEAPVGNVAIVKPGHRVCIGQRTVLTRPRPEEYVEGERVASDR